MTGISISSLPSDWLIQTQRTKATAPGWLRACLGLVLLTVCAAGAAHGLDPQKQLSQYGHDAWTSERGLPGEAVYQILQSRDGYLWIRTGSGLARFDGVRFVAMDAEIGNEPVKAICIGADGDLLIRTTTRTVVYKDRRFYDYLPPAPLPDGGTRSIFETREHEVLVGTENFIYQLDKAGPRLLRPSTGNIGAFLEDDAGTTWIGGAFSLFRFKNGRLSAPVGVATSDLGTRSLLEDHLHRMWAGTARGLYRMDGHTSVLAPVLMAGVTDMVTAMIEDRQGNIWVGTKGSGLLRLNGEKVSSIDTLSGLTDNSVLALFEDREGSIWIGTSSGLDRLRDTKLTTYTTREGMTGNLVDSVVAGTDGTLYAFCDGAGLSCMRKGAVTAFEQNAKLPSPYGVAMYQGRDGSLWLGTFKGLSRIQDGNITVYKQDHNLTRYFISAIAEDNEGLVVANSRARIVRMKPNGQVVPFSFEGKETPFTTGGMAGAYAFTMHYDRSGTLWIGSNQGLYKFVPGKPIAAALQHTVAFPVTSIYDDQGGSLWLGGRTPGLVRFRIRDGRVTRYGKRDGLFDSYLSHILPDDDGHFWISTDDGIYEVSQRDLEEFAEGRLGVVPSTRFGLADGMKTTVASDVASQPGGARTADGALWFTTMKGLVKVNPRHMLHNDLVPPVVVETVVTDGISHVYSDRLVIAPGNKAIEFHYTALSFRVPERVRFKYQLEGYDHGWVDAGSRRVAYYTNLPPGHYRFRVIAANDDGVWNEEGAAIGVELQPHYYQTVPFYLLCACLAGALAVTGNMRYTRIMRARAEHLRQVVEDRTADLRKSQWELEQLALFDTLTALPNRRLFKADFSKLCTQSRWSNFALLLIDFDKFKSINDSYGHDAGDAFLIEAASRLEAAVRATDLVARLGGDEFAILLTGEHDRASIESLCNRIVESFAAEVWFKGVNIVTSASLGVAVFPEHGETQEQLYKAADLALYAAKRMGRNKWVLYLPEMQEVKPGLTPV